MAIAIEIPQAERPEPRIDVERCAGCEECARVCPQGVLALDPLRAVITVVRDGCVGCRSCERTCPYDSIHVEGPLAVEERAPAQFVPVRERLQDAREVRRGLTHAEMLAAAARCLDCPRPTCMEGCPARNDIPGFIRLMAEDRMQDALETLRLTTELPAVCGRVCDQALQCEGACILNQQGRGAVEIGLLERYLGDWEREHGVRSKVRKPLPAVRRVDVVGAGPAGLSAAAALARAGHLVEVFEALPFGGGVLAWGVPDFTLPDAVVDEELRYLVDVGVTFHLGRRLGVDFLLDDLFDTGADAVVLAFGAEAPNVLRLPEAETLAGVTTATHFLVEAQAFLAGGDGAGAGAAGIEGPVVVIGAGNTALDVARSALRLGVDDVLCVDVLPERLVPCSQEEKHLALEEGVRFLYGVGVQALGDDGDGHVAGLDVAPAAPRRALGRRRSGPDLSRRQWFPARTVVQAMGYHVAPAAREYAAGVGVAPNGVLEADAFTGRTAQAGVWAVGDVANGPATVVEAMAMGRRCADDVLAWFGAVDGEAAALPELRSAEGGSR